jgi:arylsulfatase A-like enzyme
MQLVVPLRHERVHAMKRSGATVARTARAPIAGLIRCAVPAMLLLGTTVALAHDAPRCDVTPDQGNGTVGKVLDNCCSTSVSFKCDSHTHVSQAVLDHRPNIVLVVSDDQGYCQYGFMHGVCSGGTRDGKDCRSNIDCPSPGQCVKRTAGLATNTPLRLGDFTCRYRQPPGWPEPCKYKVGSATQPQPYGSKGGDKTSWYFHASDFPCTTTNPLGVVPDYPVPLTPNLDQLATFGAVFPRAYVGGNACKPSRSVMLYGKPHRHLLEMTGSEVGSHSIASWLLDNGHNIGTLDPATQRPRYWPFMLGKGEVLTETAAGFQGGDEKSKPDIAKYVCTPPGTRCRDAAKAAPGTTDFLKVPWEARAAFKGIGDALDVIEGQRRPNFQDKKVIVRKNFVAGSSFDCATCVHGTEAAECGTQCGSQLDVPFFLWFAPNQPHKRGRGEDYRPLYGTFAAKRQQHEARVTELDQAVGALVDELKRHCICGQEMDPDTGLGKVDGGGQAIPEKQSLWQQTVLVFLSDHGFLLPDAKRKDNENTHRTVLMVSEPRHRITKTNGTPLLPARQFPDDLVHAIDLFRTVLDYAGMPFSAGDGDPVRPNINPGDNAPDYLFARSLKSRVSDATVPTIPLRDVLYGEFADQAGTFSHDVDRGVGRSRYLITRSGLIGICLKSDGAPALTDPIKYDDAGTHTSSHARPCLLGGSGDDCPEGTCQASMRCVNDPSKICSGNSGCVELAFCDLNSHLCKYDWRGSLGDMARPLEPASSNDDSGSRSCTYDAGAPMSQRLADIAQACVPTGVDLCRPVILKIWAHRSLIDPSTASLSYAWDLNWDPDQRRNLLQDPDYLGNAASPPENSLYYKFKQCIDNDWAADPVTGEWNGNQTTCPWPEPSLP